MQSSAEKSIFLNALDQSSEAEREAYLSSACGDDAALRASVDALLSAHQQTLNPLDQPVVKAGSVPVAECPPMANPTTRQVGGDVGKTIDSYRLMELIGQGGFGLVYAALQERPVRRKVALKIIKPGTGSSEVLARFAAERQAIAMMDHPHIAQVFDAGVTADARPYFVMELVRGVPITEFVEQSNLTQTQLMELFQDVCAAVHHAHQKGIIHRDLKPSNVLVTLHDNKPVAKVIDFGVAKAMGQILTDQTIYTRLYSMIGTPLYMSPEQASMSGMDVDTRSDIYSLGVMLYELLTGTTPFDRGRLDTVGYDEMRRIIQEEEPPKPSQRLTTITKHLTATFQDGAIEQPALKNETQVCRRTTIPSDLDWIVMKALEKDRQRRYESAAAMAADIRRFLTQQPIEARPPSRLYRITKFARRNRVAILTISLVAIALLFGSGISFYQASRAIYERNQKELALQDAIQSKNQANDARQEVEQFTVRLKAANSLVGSARSYENTQQWSAAKEAYDQAIELVPNYYLVWVQRGQLMLKLQLWEEAAEDFSEAIQLDAPIYGPEWLGIPALLAYQDRHADYETLCSQVLEPTHEHPEAMNWETIRATLAAPTKAVSADYLADRTLELLTIPEGHRPPGPGFAQPNGFFGGGMPGVPGRIDRGPDRPHRQERPFIRPDGRPGGLLPNMRPPDRFIPRWVKQFVTGWAQLRAGRWEKSIQHLELSVRDRQRPESSPAHSLLAIAYYQSGRQQMAFDSLQRANEAIDQKMNQLKPAPEPFAPGFEFVEMLLVHREATELLTGKRPRIDARFIAVQQDARAWLNDDRP